VARLVTVYLKSNCSTYRRNHSSETALLKTCTDALMAVDNGMVTLFVLLDYSSASIMLQHA